MIRKSEIASGLLDVCYAFNCFMTCVTRNRRLHNLKMFECFGTQSNGAHKVSKLKEIG